MTATATANSIWFEGRAGRVARLAILSGILIHVAGFVIFHVVAEPERVPNLPSPFVSVAATSQQTEDLVALAALADSEPLFLPTRWNASAQENTSATTQINATPFDAFPPELSLGATAFENTQNGNRSLPRNPEDTLRLEPGLVFYTFGMDKSHTPADQPTGPRMELYEYQSGKLLLRLNLDPEALGDTPPANWHFAEFQILVEETGQLGQPLLLVSTDQEALDRRLGQYLRNRLAEEELSAGYYRIVVGP